MGGHDKLTAEKLKAERTLAKGSDGAATVNRIGVNHATIEVEQTDRGLDKNLEQKKKGKAGKVEDGDLKQKKKEKAGKVEDGDSSKAKTSSSKTADADGVLDQSGGKKRKSKGDDIVPAKKSKIEAVEKSGAASAAPDCKPVKW